jgi:formate-dependent nitrite reductase membrane component NrfD
VGEPRDGRYIDPARGALVGEGAQQRVSPGRAEPPAPLDRWTQPADAAPRSATYYERPVLKEPVWIWAVPAYFYVGGTAGAASVLSEVAELLRGEELSGLVRRGRWLGAVGGGIGTALLVYDLGRPERFLHMLRVFRPSSPMSVGSWVLAAATPVFVASAVLPHAGGILGVLGNAAGKAAGLLGVPLAAYTGVLLGVTAVPLWQAARRSLPPLFVASAASSAAAMLELTGLDEAGAAVVRRFATAAEAAEIGAALLLQRDVHRVARVGRPLEVGVAGALWRASKALAAAGLALSLLPGRSRAKDLASGIVGTAGGLCVRFALFEAGKASARDPRATFEQQRAGYGAAELRGAWREVQEDSPGLP